MAKTGGPPRTFKEFSDSFPKLRQAWDLLGDAGNEGPLDDKTEHLVKLAIAIGAMREGNVHSAVRKARGSGATDEELRQVVALAASVIGMSSTVAVWTWIRDIAKKV
ncbi:MAG TPA: carboxymuconolactone decarboxylase family protein [Thermoanaerobaculia bacterium]